MDIAYLFFEKENIRIPFYDYDKNMFMALINSRLGYWSKLDRQYFIPRSQYDKNQIKGIFSGKPFVEVTGVPENPVIINHFHFNDKRITTDIIEQPLTSNYSTETFFTPAAQRPQRELLPEHFSDHWCERLEAELRSRKYSRNTRQ
jgi:hypothetical protein